MFAIFQTKIFFYNLFWSKNKKSLVCVILIYTLEYKDNILQSQCLLGPHTVHGLLTGILRPSLLYNTTLIHPFVFFTYWFNTLIDTQIKILIDNYTVHSTLHPYIRTHNTSRNDCHLRLYDCVHTSRYVVTIGTIMSNINSKTRKVIVCLTKLLNEFHYDFWKIVTCLVTTDTLVTAHLSVAFSLLLRN